MFRECQDTQMEGDTRTHHVEGVSAGEPELEEKEPDEGYTLLNQRDFYKEPILVNLQLNGQNVKMEVDTGAVVTV